MALTVHRYEFNNSYILEKLTDRYKIDFYAADSFHREMIDLYYGLENLLARFFDKDDNYGIILGPRQDIMTQLGTHGSEFDFIVDLCNNGPNMTIFYTAESIYQTLKKVENNKQFLIEKKLVDEPMYLEKLTACLTFAEKAKNENNLMHFWSQ
jgi:hypothetical protein